VTVLTADNIDFYKKPNLVFKRKKGVRKNNVFYYCQGAMQILF